MLESVARIQPAPRAHEKLHGIRQRDAPDDLAHEDVGLGRDDRQIEKSGRRFTPRRVVRNQPPRRKGEAVKDVVRPFDPPASGHEPGAYPPAELRDPSRRR